MHDMVICDQTQPLEYPQLESRQGQERATQGQERASERDRPAQNVWVIDGEVSRVPRPQRYALGPGGTGPNGDVHVVPWGFGGAYLV